MRPEGRENDELPVGNSSETNECRPERRDWSVKREDGEWHCSQTGAGDIEFYGNSHLKRLSTRCPMLPVNSFIILVSSSLFHICFTSFSAI